MFLCLCAFVLFAFVCCLVVCCSCVLCVVVFVVDCLFECSVNCSLLLYLFTIVVWLVVVGFCVIGNGRFVVCFCVLCSVCFRIVCDGLLFGCLPLLLLCFVFCVVLCCFRCFRWLLFVF